MTELLPTIRPGKIQRVLVTGGCGFIGSALVRWFILNTSARVLNLDKLTYAGNLASLSECEQSPNYAFRQLDICQAADLAKEIATFEPDCIFHLAAESHVDRSIDRPADFIQTNLVGTYSVLEGARRYWSHLPEARRERFRVVHVSTDEVYGTLRLDESRFGEDSRYLPNSPYAATKAAQSVL